MRKISLLRLFQIRANGVELHFASLNHPHPGLLPLAGEGAKSKKDVHRHLWTMISRRWVFQMIIFI